MSKDYDVGYGRTPKHTRFVKGESGNKCRKKKRPEFQAEMVARGMQGTFGEALGAAMKTAAMVGVPDQALIASTSCTSMIPMITSTTRFVMRTRSSIGSAAKESTSHRGTALAHPPR